MSTQLLSSYTLYSVSTAVTTKEGTSLEGHNKRPILVCEGLCSGECNVPVRHEFFREVYRLEGDQYEQEYKCTGCHTVRKFGATVARVATERSHN